MRHFASAQREVDTLAADLRSRFTIKQTSGMNFRIEPMHEDLVREVRPIIMALMGAVTFVLLIACANVANLLLVRAATRERELAVRAALGGTRGRLVQQLLTESLLLSIAAAGLGLAFAWAGVRVLLALGPENLPRLGQVSVDPAVVTFAALAGVVSVVLFGLVPAVRASRPDVMDLLRRSGRSGGLASGGWMRTAVVTLEVALSFVLLVGSGLMIRSFIELQRAAPGYDPNQVLTFSTPNLRLPTPAARQAFVRDLRTRLLALPGVTDVTAATPLPLDGRVGLARWGTEEALADPAKFQQATTHVVQPGYFEAMRTRIIEGRGYTEEDNNRQNSRLLIIDRILAGKAFPGQSAVGKTIVARVNTPEPQRYEVIGVVDHQRHTDLARDGREAMFLTDGYFGFGAANRWVVRTSGDPMAHASTVKALVSELNPRTGAIEVQPMSAFIAEAQAQTKFALVLIGIFAGVALVLAAVGPLQRPLDNGAPADAGDRRADGVRRRPRRHLQDDGGPGPAPEWHRDRHRDRRGTAADERDEVDARRCRTDRPADLRRHGGGIPGHLGNCLRIARAARIADGPDGGPARRVEPAPSLSRWDRPRSATIG